MKYAKTNVGGIKAIMNLKKINYIGLWKGARRRKMADKIKWWMLFISSCIGVAGALCLTQFYRYMTEIDYLKEQIEQVAFPLVDDFRHHTAHLFAKFYRHC